jgi:hypothetical protein
VFWLEERPAADATATAPPIDGGRPIRWGRLSWEGSLPEAPRAVFSVRGGPRAIPDDTWSDWSDGWSDVDQAIPLPPSRFLQWRVTFKGNDPRPALASVTVSGYEPNLPPQIERFEVLPPGELSADGRPGGMDGVTETFRNGLKVEYSVDSRQVRRPAPEDAAVARGVRTFAWRSFDPNGDRLAFTLHYQRVGEEAWSPLGQQTSESLRAWDTREVPDGVYVVRLKASDAVANSPDEALEAVRLSAPLRVDNSPPRVSGLRVRRDAGGISVAFTADDAASALAEAWLELPGGDERRLDPKDGICDSRREEFSAALPFPGADKPVGPPPWRVRLGVADRAGNVAFEEGEAK